MQGLSSSPGRITNGVIDAYMVAIEDCTPAGVAMACRRFLRGEVERSFGGMPSAAEVAQQARMLDSVLNRVVVKDGLISYRIGELPPPGTEPLGETKLEVAGRMMDVTEWTLAEKDEARTTGNVPASRKEITTDATRRIEIKPKGFN